jgi:hypothetical protein
LGTSVSVLPPVPKVTSVPVASKRAIASCVPGEATACPATTILPSGAIMQS